MRFTSNYSLCIYNSSLDKIRQKELGGVILSKDNINYSKECYSEHGVNRQLSGRRNKRLHSNVCLNNGYTAAYSDQAYVDPETNVTAPSEVQTKETKNWVDNGSKL